MIFISDLYPKDNKYKNFPEFIRFCFFKEKKTWQFLDNSMNKFSVYLYKICKYSFIYVFSSSKCIAAIVEII